MYSSLADMEKRVPRAKIDELCKPLTATQVVEGLAVDGVEGEGLIPEADAVIDLYNTQQWSSDAKLGCSRALAIELLFGRHGTGKIPKVHADIALDWKNRLESSGLRVTGGWYRPAHDPSMNETADDLDALTTRDPLE